VIPKVIVCANDLEAAVVATPSIVANSKGQHQEPINAGILMKRDKNAIIIDFLSKSSGALFLLVL